MSPEKDTTEETILPKNYIHIPSDHEETVTSGFGEQIFQQMKKNADRIAQIDSATGLKETYSSLLSRCVRAAQSMQAKGLAKDDVIALCCYNNMDYTVPLVASWFIGVRMAPLDPTAPLSDVIHCLKLVTPKVIFIDSDSQDLIESAVKELSLDCEIVIFGETTKYTPFSEYLIERGGEDEFRPVPAEHRRETACILFSSGTTGLPKGVCVTQYVLSHLSLADTSKAPDFKVILPTTSPYWLSNIVMVPISIFDGTTRVIYRAFDENTVVKVIQDYGVEFTGFTPVQCIRFIKNPATCHYDTSKLKRICVGGSNITYYQLLEILKLFPHTSVYNVYGMTEIGVHTFIPIPQTREDLLRTKQCTVGYPIPGFYYKIVDPDTETVLGPNQRGELRFKNNGIMTGYYRQPELTKAAFDSEGYIKTGDIMYYDETNRFYYVDRIKDIFKYKQYHISPTVIEGEILNHPDVLECAVVGIPDGMDSELVTGVVVLRAHSNVQAEDIVKYVNDRVADRNKLRGGVFIVETLPRTPIGKLCRKKVRDMVMKIMAEQQ